MRLKGLVAEATLDRRGAERCGRENRVPPCAWHEGAAHLQIFGRLVQRTLAAGRCAAVRTPPA